jgi:enediyne biosynthesis protein E4
MLNAHYSFFTIRFSLFVFHFMQFVRSLLLALTLFAVSCQHKSDPANTAISPLRFERLEAAQTGLDFANMVPYNDTFNCYTFRNFYNGGGVGVGDVNNDGLQDVFFCGNLSPNQLYLNLGNWRFQNITNACGMKRSHAWTAGVAFADVNGDGWLDIYTCKSGPPGGPDRHNELWINNGAAPNGEWSGTFSEQSASWGLDNRGLSTHAAFFDFDRDGDLDCYLLNNSMRSVGGYDYRPGQRNTPDPEGGNKLLENHLNERKFLDVTQQAGIYNSAIGFGLGVTIGDYDRDGWQDMFISNDFFERDYLYHNEGNGRFKEVLPELMDEISKGSMGADMSDLNNDGFPDLFVTEMTPPDDRRYKTKAAFDDWNTYQTMQNTGYHRQFGRNVLQINRKGRYFAETGRLAGVHFSDWSWGALCADFDNDGHKDIFVANGIGKDLLDQDYINFYADPVAVRKVLTDNPGQGIKTLIDKMPSEPIVNALFRQRAGAAGDFPQFDNVAAQSGLQEPTFSNGSAYADLDNDGDLDLLVNNVNMPCFAYKNESKGGNWLKIDLKGSGNNPFALGAKITLKAGNQQFYQELAPMRGFESCVDVRPNFGVGSITVLDSVVVEFISGKRRVLTQVPANQTLILAETEATPAPPLALEPAQAVLSLSNLSLPAQLNDPSWSDFNPEPLLFRMYSAEGPRTAVADVNGDQLDDLLIGAPKNAPTRLYLQTPNGQLQLSRQPAFEAHQLREDQALAFFDADNDGDQDLYIGSGSTEFQGQNTGALDDRFYLNDGRGQYFWKEDALPGGKPYITSCVRPADVDADGDTDLFVGMRMLPGQYGVPCGALMLLNDGHGYFEPAVQQFPALNELGMVTDAAWADLDADRDLDLVTVGEWEPIRVFYNEQGKLEAPTTLPYSGWWNCLIINDLNRDGRPDLVAGNQGLNSRFQVPLSLWVNDFDQNGQTEHILCQSDVPLVLRNDLLRQMPSLKKKFLQFSQYAGQNMIQIFGAAVLKSSIQKTSNTLASMVFYNEGKGQFKGENLPLSAQISPIYAISATDLNRDGYTDLLIGGNHSRCKPETGVYLASRGLVCWGQAASNWTCTDLYLPGCIRDFALLQLKGQPHVGVSRTDEPLVFLKTF